MRLRRDKRGDAVGRSGRESSLSGVPGAKFFCEKPGIGTKMKNSLNFVSTCLKVVDTRRPDTFKRTSMFVQVNGYINYRLTDCLFTDHLYHAALLQLRNYRTGKLVAAYL